MSRGYKLSLLPSIFDLTSANCLSLPIPSTVSHLSLLTVKTGILSFTFQCLANNWNVLKQWECQLKTWEKLAILYIWYFKILFSRCYLQQNLIYIFVISTLSVYILIQSQIDLGFHWFYRFYLGITWKIYGRLSHQRRGNTGSSLYAYNLWFHVENMLHYIKYN